jgi:hypothetical protein
MAPLPRVSTGPLLTGQPTIILDLLHLKTPEHLANQHPKAKKLLSTNRDAASPK